MSNKNYCILHKGTRVIVIKFRIKFKCTSMTLGIYIGFSCLQCPSMSLCTVPKVVLNPEGHSLNSCLVRIIKIEKRIQLTNKQPLNFFTIFFLNTKVRLNHSIQLIKVSGRLNGYLTPPYLRYVNKMLLNPFQDFYIVR